MKLEHVAINVPDPAEFSQWLVTNLGMRIVVANTAAPFAHFLADEAGSMIELYNNSAAPMPDYHAMNPFNLRHRSRHRPPPGRRRNPLRTHLDNTCRRQIGLSARTEWRASAVCATEEAVDLR